MELVAKPIVKDQLWVITNGKNKVGNLEYSKDGYNLRLDGRSSVFDSTETIEKSVKIRFESPISTDNKQQLPYAVWPTNSKTYNNVFDIKRKVHVYTKTAKSKCFYAAGWFKIKMNEGWQNIFCPKFIFIQRYEYQGPFMREDEIK